MKVGLLFGSFDPIHIGHLAIANYLVESGYVNQLWFVVTPHNPLKNKQNLLDDYHRLEMVVRAINSDNRFIASDVEFGLPKPSYTIDTLNFLKEKYRGDEFYIIIGADNYLIMKEWKDWETLIGENHFLVYPRPGFEHREIGFGNNFQIVDAPVIEVSSTFIRNAIAEGNEVGHLLHPKVLAYILEMNFYKNKKPDQK